MEENHRRTPARGRKALIEFRRIFFHQTGKEMKQNAWKYDVIVVGGKLPCKAGRAFVC